MLLPRGGMGRPGRLPRPASTTGEKLCAALGTGALKQQPTDRLLHSIEACARAGDEVGGRRVRVVQRHAVLATAADGSGQANRWAVKREKLGVSMLAACKWYRATQNWSLQRQAVPNSCQRLAQHHIECAACAGPGGIDSSHLAGQMPGISVNSGPCIRPRNRPEKKGTKARATATLTRSLGSSCRRWCAPRSSLARRRSGSHREPVGLAGGAHPSLSPGPAQEQAGKHNCGK